MRKFLSGVRAAHALIILIALNLFLAYLIGDQYGQTWDEPSFYLYGERSFEAYSLGLSGRPLVPERHIFFLDLRYYGPFYTSLGWKIVDLLTPVLNNWAYPDLWHLVNFGFFQVALISLYFLAKRYMSQWMAFFVVLLFNTQPLIFGHAFINPKDIPFLSFFLVSSTLGLYMADAVKTVEEDEQKSGSYPQFQLHLAILVGLFVLTFVGKDLMYSAIQSLVSALYSAPTETFLGKIFSLMVGNSNRLPLENYVHKAFSAHLERTVLYLLLILSVGRKLYLVRLGKKKPELVLRINTQLWVLVLISGLFLGLATSIRLLAPFAGLLVAIYALGTRGKNSFPVLIYYFSLAAFTCYLTWPFLWDSPLYNFFEAFQVMRDFPFTAEVRFMGDNISPLNLPWYYIPFLITVQSTEPAVLLAWVGFIFLIFTIWKHNLYGNLVLLGWFILPIGLQIFLSSNAYDNFRQFLFVLPPMFVLAGIGLESLLSMVKHRTTRGLVYVICILPGLIGLVTLHPVQYIYYNGFVGGVSGAEGNFELDYWLTSYREAASYINEHASPNANILAFGSAFNGARDDLTIYSFMSEDDIDGLDVTFEYAVITTRFSSHLDVFEDAELVYEVRRGGALLAVVRKLP